MKASLKLKLRRAGLKVPRNGVEGKFGPGFGDFEKFLLILAVHSAGYLSTLAGPFKIPFRIRHGLCHRAGA